MKTFKIISPLDNNLEKLLLNNLLMIAKINQTSDKSTPLVDIIQIKFSLPIYLQIMLLATAKKIPKWPNTIKTYLLKLLNLVFIQ